MVHQIPFIGYLFQYAVAFASTLMIACTALAHGWTSPTLPILLGENSPIPITNDEGSWIVVMMLLGIVVSALPNSWLMDKYGRKVTLLMSTVPLLLGWILVIIAESVSFLYIARFFFGLAHGAAYAISPMYLGEIASDKIRGSFGALITVMSKVGILYVYSIAPYVSIQLMAILSIVPVIIYIIIFIWLPESPYFLLGKNRNDAALNSLIRLRKGCERQSIELELNTMKVAVEKSNENKRSFSELWSVENRKPFIIVLGLVTAQILTGGQTIIAYSQTIFTAINFRLFQPNETSIIFGVVQLLSAIMASATVDYWGRRPLLLLSVSGCTTCNAIVAIYFLLLRYGYDILFLNWLPTLAIMLFTVFYTCGLGAVTFAIIGESFPKNLKARIVPIFSIITGAFQFILSKLFQIVSDNLGNDYTFFGLAILSGFFIIFVFLLVQETKGKSLDLILLEYSGKQQTNKSNDEIVAK